MNPKVDQFLAQADKWQKEFKKLRAICLDCKLTEEFKWGHPCYSEGGGNVVLIHGFKEYCAILFVKGALLKDKKKILVTQTENVQAARQVRFTSPKEIDELAPVLKAYILEAAENEKAGLEVRKKETGEFAVPGEFQSRLDSSPALKNAFASLTPGRQRAYLLHFSSAKQSKTREARIEKCVPRIMDGLGLDD